jgi:ribosomal protein L11 methyltransferase
MLVSARRRGLIAQVEVGEADARDEAWASQWKKHYKPFRIADKLYIAPAWNRTFKSPRGSQVVRLDPGQAFGTGRHATTKLALQLLLPRVRRGMVVLDIGCGSGILGIAAAKCGAHVYASDTDPLAIRATRDNFATNDLSAAAIHKGRGVPAPFPRADLIVANITARVLTPLAAALARKLLPGGVLITSGIDKKSGERVLKALARQRLALAQTEGRAHLESIGGVATVTGTWRAYAHRKRSRG